MEIISFEFFGFVLFSLIVYYLLPGRFQNLFLLGVSGYFLATWHISYVIYLGVFVIVNYHAARIIARSEKRRKFWLWFFLGLNILAFIGYQYGVVFTPWITKGLPFLSDGLVLDILIPLGFSYYFLEVISYLLDVYRKWVEPSGNLVDFALYLAYFPKLISGPIERARTFLPLLRQKRVVDNAVVERGLGLIIVGLLRAVIFAGLLIIFSDRNLFEDPLAYSSTALVAGLFIYAFTLYNQFAGYTSIVRGVSALFGIELTRNFAQPFFSKDFSDLWTRWHISLSQWLRDYIYMPLSRSFLRKNPSSKNIFNLFVPAFVTMLVSGIWHGSGWHFLLWGAMNGAYLVLENVINLFRKTDIQRERSWGRRVVGLMIAAPLAFTAAIPFRMDLTTSRLFLYGMIKVRDWALPDWRPILIIFVVVLFDLLQFRSNEELVYKDWPRWLQALVIAMVLVGVVIVFELQTALSTFKYP